MASFSSPSPLYSLPSSPSRRRPSFAAILRTQSNFFLAPSPSSPSSSSPSHSIAPDSIPSNNTTKRRPSAVNVDGGPTSGTGPDPGSGVPVYKPRSYEVLVSDAARSLVQALDDGITRLEVDFPPLPTSISSYKGSSDEFIDANIQLALAVVRKFHEAKGSRSCIVFPDQPEKRRASQLFKTAIDTVPRKKFMILISL